MLERLGERAEAEGVANIEGLVSGADRLPVLGAVAESALVANVLHEVPAWEQLLGDIARVLKPGDALAVVEWNQEQTEMGPPPAERLAPREVERALRAVGYGTTSSPSKLGHTTTA